MAQSRQTKVDAIYAAVRQRILNGTYLPGQRLTVKMLTAHHATSGTPVREALRLLAQEGLVDIIPYVGAQVRRPSKAEIEEAYFIRGHLEALATTVAGPYLTHQDLDQLQALVAQMDAADQANDGVRYGALNQAFHLAIYQRGPYPKLVHMIRDLWSHETLFQLVFTTQPTRRQSSQREHREILALLQSGAFQEAGALTLQHKLHTSETVSLDLPWLRPTPNDVEA